MIKITPKQLSFWGAILFFIASVSSIFSYIVTIRNFNIYSTIGYFAISVVFNGIMALFFYYMYKTTPDEVFDEKNVETMFEDILKENKQTLDINDEKEVKDNGIITVKKTKAKRRTSRRVQ